jgi:hypothetical protein
MSAAIEPTTPIAASPEKASISGTGISVVAYAATVEAISIPTAILDANAALEFLWELEWR